MKKAFKIITIILSIILLKLLITYTLNEIIILNYEKENYNTTLLKPLYILNINEPYIVYYNEGNILYRKKEYDKAIDRYNEALDRNPPEKRVCDIRINKSLALVYNIKTTDKNEIYNELEEAKNNLYKNGCANKENDNGKSEDAEKLEEEIKKLQEQQKNSSDDNKDNQNDQNNENDDTETPDVEDQLKENERNANESRQDSLNSSENVGNFSYFSGKRW